MFVRQAGSLATNVNPWADAGEFDAVYRDIYDFDNPSNQRRALAVVDQWRMRAAKIPLSVESTASLVALELSFNEAHGPLPPSASQQQRCALDPTDSSSSLAPATPSRAVLAASAAAISASDPILSRLLTRAAPRTGPLPPAAPATRPLTVTQEFRWRHEYSLVLLRFVNGIVDKLQRAATASSVSMLASHAGIPRMFVDIRHDATHNDTPSLALLRLAAGKALQWLRMEYWSRVVDGRRGKQALVVALLEAYTATAQDELWPHQTHAQAPTQVETAAAADANTSAGADARRGGAHKSSAPHSANVAAGGLKRARPPATVAAAAGRSCDAGSRGSSNSSRARRGSNKFYLGGDSSDDNDDGTSPRGDSESYSSDDDEGSSSGIGGSRLSSAPHAHAVAAAARASLAVAGAEVITHIGAAVAAATSAAAAARRPAAPAAAVAAAAAATATWTARQLDTSARAAMDAAARVAKPPTQLYLAVATRAARVVAADQSQAALPLLPRKIQTAPAPLALFSSPFVSAADLSSSGGASGSAPSAAVAASATAAAAVGVPAALHGIAVDVAGTVAAESAAASAQAAAEGVALGPPAGPLVEGGVVKLLAPVLVPTLLLPQTQQQAQGRHVDDDGDEEDAVAVASVSLVGRCCNFAQTLRSAQVALLLQHQQKQQQQQQQSQRGVGADADAAAATAAALAAWPPAVAHIRSAAFAQCASEALPLLVTLCSAYATLQPALVANLTALLTAHADADAVAVADADMTGTGASTTGMGDSAAGDSQWFAVEWLRLLLATQLTTGALIAPAPTPGGVSQSASATTTATAAAAAASVTAAAGAGAVAGSAPPVVFRALETQTAPMSACALLLDSQAGSAAAPALGADVVQPWSFLTVPGVDAATVAFAVALQQQAQALAQRTRVRMQATERQTKNQQQQQQGQGQAQGQGGSRLSCVSPLSTVWQRLLARVPLLTALVAVAEARLSLTASTAVGAGIGAGTGDAAGPGWERLQAWVRWPVGLLPGQAPASLNKEQ